MRNGWAIAGTVIVVLCGAAMILVIIAPYMVER